MVVSHLRPLIFTLAAQIDQAVLARKSHFAMFLFCLNWPWWAMVIFGALSLIATATETTFADRLETIRAIYARRGALIRGFDQGNLL
jgi:hypothetical protein